MEEGHLDFGSAMKKLQGNKTLLYPVFFDSTFSRTI